MTAVGGAGVKFVSIDLKNKMAGDGAMSSDLLDRTDDGLVKSMGYKETLHRGFTGAFMNFAFTMTTVGCLTSLFQPVGEQACQTAVQQQSSMAG